MTIKELIKLFVPPIIFKLKRKLVRQRDTTINPVVTDKQVLYEYLVDMNYRSKLNFQDLETLSTDYSFRDIGTISSDTCEPNFYGDFYSLLHYSGIKILLPPKKFTIQHGILYDFLPNWNKNTNVDVFLVWSDLIKDLYKKVSNIKEIIAIGAPFFYSKSLLSTEQIFKEKKRLGKNLLAFPMHSTHFTDIIYDSKNFINLLKNQQKLFDNVRVCLYWKDIQKGIDKLYKDEGLECVCCGHMFDIFFLSRLKSLLEIADATISNGVGSHIGYSVFMNKPHYCVPNEYSVNDIVGNEGREEKNMKQYSQNYKEIYDGFINNNSYIITDFHKKIVDKFWGVSNIMQPDSIRDILESCYIHLQNRQKTYSNGLSEKF